MHSALTPFLLTRVGFLCLVFSECEVSAMGVSKLSSLDLWVQKSQLTEMHASVNRRISKDKFYIITYLQKIFWVTHVNKTSLPPFSWDSIKASGRDS